MLSFSIQEMKDKIVENFILFELKDYDVKTSLKWKEIDKFIFKNIYLKDKKIADKILIDFNFRYFIVGKIGFDEISVKKIDLNSLEKIEKSKENGSFFIPVAIEKLKIDGFYRYKNEKIDFYANLNDISINRLFDADIKKIIVDSKYAKIDGSGKIRKNIAYLDSDIFLKKSFKDIDIKRINPIKAKLKIDKRQISFTLKASAKDFYKNQKFLAKVEAVVDFVFDKKRLISKIKGEIDHKKVSIDINGEILYDKKLIYSGFANIKSKTTFKNIYEDFYKNIDITFSGDLNKIEGKIENKKLSANFFIKDKRFLLKMQKLYVNDIFKKIPNSLNDGYFTLNIDGDFERILRFNFNLLSNIVNIDGEYKNKRITAKIDLPKKSVLNIDKKLFPIQTKIALEKEIAADIKNSYFIAKVFIKNSTVKSNIDISKSAYIEIDGDLKHIINAKIDIYSLNDLKNIVSSFYKLPKFNADAELHLKISFDLKNMSYSGKINSPWIWYEYKKYNYLALTFFETHFHGNMKNFVLDYYAAVFPNHGFYATKNSKFLIFKDRLEVKEFWIEDKIKIEGFYSFDNFGKFLINCKNYRYSSIEGTATVDSEINIDINGKKISAEGEIVLNSAKIFYNPRKIKTVEDEDIIIVDKETEYEKSQFFKENVALNIHIYSKKPILYSIKDLFATLKPDITVYKEYQKDLQILGQILVLKGKYNFNGKIFAIKKSEIDFYGPPTNPFLNILVEHEKDEYIIYIKISGDLKNPIILFESEPYLSQNDILSMILFDSKLSSLLFKTAGGDKLTGIFSNFFVKDLAQSFGLKLDKFSLITSGSRIGFEIGKKIADKITILYKNDQISTVIIRYKISKRLQSEVTISPEKNAIDLFYKIEK